MTRFPSLSRREFLRSVSIAAAGSALPACSTPRKSSSTTSSSLPPLAQFDYADVDLAPGPHEQQLDETHRVLMGLSDDSILKPLREMSGLPAPGDDLGGWYHYKPDYVIDRDHGYGFAPSCAFGQWVSTLARYYAIRKDPATREEVLRLNRLYAQTISGDYYQKNRFPTYCYDKILLGLIDSHKYVGDRDAFSILEHTTNAALPHFPKHAVEHDTPWRPGKTDKIWTWDESYTISENLFLAYQRGAGSRYRDLATQYLDDVYYDPLAEGRNNLAGRHAYSHVNSLSSAMQAWLTLGSRKHLAAAKHGFDMLAAQSFATGGWGPYETLCAPNGPELFNSLSDCHASFETPCGAYAHFKLTRYLLRVTRNSCYGDSMERVMYNTVLGAKPLMPDGRTFYYSDYNFKARKIYSPDQHWACCSGTLPQVAADYRINTAFHDPNSRSLWLNLYIPSTLRWNLHGAQLALTQRSLYPFDDFIQFELQTSRPAAATLNFRIPAWITNPSVSVNGRQFQTDVTPGTFTSIHREWQNGDRVELHLPMTVRLEPIDPLHPQTVALCFGPLVLFAITDSQPVITRNDLLAARKIDRRTWQVTPASGPPFNLIPFTDIAEQQYSTYLRVT
jgi:DUF1680 family protein